MLLPAVLSSKSTNQRLDTPPFRAILASKMAALWPLWTAEMFVFLPLCAVCTVWVWGFIGNAALAAIAVGIALAFCIAEALQIQAAFNL